MLSRWQELGRRAFAGWDYRRGLLVRPAKTCRGKGATDDLLLGGHLPPANGRLGGHLPPAKRSFALLNRTPTTKRTSAAGLGIEKLASRAPRGGRSPGGAATLPHVAQRWQRAGEARLLNTAARSAACVTALGQPHLPAAAPPSVLAQLPLSMARSRAGDELRYGGRVPWYVPWGRPAGGLATPTQPKSMPTRRHRRR